MPKISYEGLSATVAISVPDTTRTYHQLTVFAELASGSLDTGAAFTIDVKPILGGDNYMNAETKLFSTDGVIYLAQGRFRAIRITPNATFTGDTDAPTYSVFYESW
jgi:hypothetical protein